MKITPIFAVHRVVNQDLYYVNLSEIVSWEGNYFKFLIYWKGHVLDFKSTARSQFLLKNTEVQCIKISNTGNFVTKRESDINNSLSIYMTIVFEILE